MRRREFITLISGVVAAWPLGTSAQPAKSPIRIGLLPFGSPSNAYDESLVEAFRSGLRQAGLIEGRDIVLDIEWTTGSDADTDKAVAELQCRDLRSGLLGANLIETRRPATGHRRWMVNRMAADQF